MTPQGWLNFYNILGFGGAILTIAGGIDVWHYSNRVDADNDTKISELLQGKNTLLKNNAEISHQNILILRAMEEDSRVKFKRNANGEIEGLIVEMKGDVKAESSATAILTSQQTK